MKNYYEILGIQPGSDLNQIKSAYREKARKFHPDTSKTETLDKFLLIQEAYETLCEPHKRECYDLELNKVNASRHRWSPTNTPAERASENTDWNFIQNDFFYLADWKDEENDRFLEIILTPREARTGTVVFIDLPLVYTCPICQGTGEAYFQICPKCRGTGKAQFLKEFQINLPPVQKDGDHLIVDLVNAKKLRLRLNVIIRVLNSSAVFSEIF